MKNNQTGEVVYSFSKNAQEVVQCEIRQYNKNLCLGLYAYTKQMDGNLHSTGKGLCMKIETWKKEVMPLLQIILNGKSPNPSNDKQ